MYITFTNPHYLWILLVLPILIIFHLFTLKYAKESGIKIANFRYAGHRKCGQSIRMEGRKKLIRFWVGMYVCGAEKSDLGQHVVL